MVSGTIAGVKPLKISSYFAASMREYVEIIVPN